MIPLAGRRSSMGTVRLALVALFAGSLLGEAPAAWAQEQADAEGCVDALAARIQARYERVRDLSARFEQVTDQVSLGHSGGGALRAQGEVVFAKPGRMRWTYREPEPSVVVSDGESLWIYDPEAEEAQHLPLGSGFLSGAAIQFLLGEGNLSEQFEVSSGPCDERPTLLRLVPREDAAYERLEIRADPETGEVTETRVVDLLGNVTRVRFRDVEVNREPAPELFRFEAPPGVRVIELPQAGNP